MLQVKLVKSPIGNTARNRATVAALGLRKMHQTVYLPDNPSVRGMIHRVKHMLTVAEIDDSAAPTRAKSKPSGKARTAPKPEAANAAKAAPAPKPEPKPEAAETAAPEAEAKPKAAAKPKAEAKTETKKPAAKKPAAPKSSDKGPKPKSAKAKSS